MGPVPASSSRLDALGTASAAELEEWLRLAPLVEYELFDAPPSPLSLMAARRPLSRRRQEWTVDELANLALSPAGVALLVEGLDASTRALLRVLAFRGGRLSRPAAIAEVAWLPDLDPASEADAAARRLRFLLLAEPERSGDDWLRLAPHARASVPAPGVSAEAHLDDLRADQLAAILLAHGLAPVPARKVERRAAVLAVLTDGERLRQVVAGLGRESRELLKLLLEAVNPVSLSSLGLRRPYLSTYGREPSAIDILERYGLVSVDHWDDRCWAWREVVAALRPRLLVAWPREPTANVQPLAADIAGVPPVVGLLDRLLARWRAHPPPALAEGGLGVAPVRAAAKGLGAPAGHVGLLVNLAVRLGLLRSETRGFTGRGYSRRANFHWVLDGSANRWTELAPLERWSRLLHAWLSVQDFTEADGLPERVGAGLWVDRAPLHRRLVLRALEGLPVGTGIEVEPLAAWLSHRHAELLWPPLVTGVIEALRAFGMVPSDGPVGLTTLGRALLAGDLSSIGVGEADTFHVQADHTIIAPPDLAGALVATLDRIAETESDAGARVLRITERSLAMAFDGGLTAEQVVTFLSEHASAELPQNVTHLIADVERRHGSLQVAAATTVVHTDDPVRLAAAVGAKAAKLRMVGDTVAVSTLSPAKVFEALRAKDLMPSFDDEGAPSAPARKRSPLTGAAAPSSAVPGDESEASAPFPPLGELPYRSAAAVAERARQLAGE